MSNAINRALGAPVLLMAAACSTAPAPEPGLPIGARGPDGEALGVRVAAETTWPTAGDVPALVIPVRVEIANGSGFPLLIRATDVALMAPDGRRLNALPPYPAGDESRPEPPSPRLFEVSRFQVAPHLAAAYPDLPAWPGRFPVDREYHALYFPYWRELPLPREEMLSRWLPEGVVETGGTARGFLYFQRLTTSAGRVQLRFDLVSARDTARLGTVMIPVEVTAGRAR